MTRLAALGLLLFAPLASAGGGVNRVGDLEVPRAAHTASLLPAGEVLVAGGCTLDSCETDARAATTEIYSPGARRFRPGPRLTRARVGHLAVTLRDGRVLIAGGWSGSALTRAVEVYAPRQGRFHAVGALREARGGAAAVRLRDGRVLVVGGSAGGERFLRSAELFDPRTGRFRSTGRLRLARAAHVATLLSDGRVLVVGGSNESGVLASTEVYDPRTGAFRRGPRLNVARHKHDAVTLRDGSVLVVGGSDERDFRGRYSSAELLRAGRRAFVRVGPMAYRRFKLSGSVVALPSGGALVAGGARRVEMYDPRHRTFWSQVGDLTGELSFATATRLREGPVLVVGGYDASLAVSRAAWLASPR